MTFANNRLSTNVSEYDDVFCVKDDLFEFGPMEAIPSIKYTVVCIVLPTYNEAKNIRHMLNTIFSTNLRRQYESEHIVLNVLVVDDNSPDGTAQIVRDYQKINPQVHLLFRKEKDGLGAAYIAGMQHAMKLLNPDIIFEMDADHSHDPKHIVEMVQEIQKGSDLVIGSRYVTGGSIPDDWGLNRKLISQAANLYVKTLLGIKQVKDCTGGYRAIRTSKLKEIDFATLKTKGYAFQVSLLEELRRHDAVMSEVPIHFKNRTKGTSKMRLADILEEGKFVFLKSLENTFYPKKNKKVAFRLLLLQNKN
ncbi:MAG TPA: polyprenol monophosphomannose synthase [Acidobacteriota bacterium]|nr:polyprenol monophosphomannose synthase [Acidobacteriota bacterium]